MLDDPDLRLLLDLAPSALLLLQRGDRSRPAPTIRLINRAFAELVGASGEALIGRSLRTLAALVEADGELALLLASATTGEPFAGRLRFRAGERRSVGATVRGASLLERPDHYAVWLQTGPEPAPLTVRSEAGEFFRLLAGLSGDCFYELAVDVDCGLRLVWADLRLAEITGYQLDELQTLGGFFGLVAADDLPELQRRNLRLLTNQPGPIRYRLRRKGGELRCVVDHARAERHPDGDTIRRVVGSTVDRQSCYFNDLAMNANAMQKLIVPIGAA